MLDPTVLWPTLLGVAFLVVGIISWRGERAAVPVGLSPTLVALGPAFIAAALAAFAGEHFTIAATLATLVPAWLPGRLFIAYLVGIAHLAAALSFVARRYVRWSAPLLALMFALFALLMDLPAAITHPGVRIAWSLAARQLTFAVGALALFAIVTQRGSPARAATVAGIARVWTAGVLVFYGVENLLAPRLWPGVPAMVPTASWVPAPTVIAYATGTLLVLFGLVMLVGKYAALAAEACGALMLLLTIALFVPEYVRARDAQQYLVAINFVFDTLLFAGTMLVIARAIARAGAGVPAASAPAPASLRATA